MADNSEGNFILEMLQKMRREMTDRFDQLESQISSLREDVAEHKAETARQHLSLVRDVSGLSRGDRLNQADTERLERRIEALEIK